MGPSEADLERGPLRYAIAADIAYTPSLNNALGLGDVGAKEHRYGADARLHWRGLSLKAEMLLGDRGNNDASRGFWRYASYLQAGYVLPWTTHGIQWEPVGRFQQFDRNRDADGLVGTDYTFEETETRIYELGATAYLAEHNAKIHLEYRRNDFLEGPVVDKDGGPLLDDSVLVFIQLGWL
jgi:hypothetical protein